MKNAITQVATIYVDCPYCEYTQENPVDGSYLWDVLNPTAQPTMVCQAPNCDHEFKLPNSVVHPDLRK